MSRPSSVAPVRPSVTGIFLRDINQREGIFVGVLNETGEAGGEGDRETRRTVDADRTCRFRGGRAVGVSDGRNYLNCGSVADCVAACVVERSSSMDG